MADGGRRIKVTLEADTSKIREAIAQAKTEVLKQSWEYRLAIALGYEPESWNGMWKLVADNPFTVGPDYVDAEEVVYHDGDGIGVSRFDEDADKVITQTVRHPLPEGWITELAYRIIPPSPARN